MRFGAFTTTCVALAVVSLAPPVLGQPSRGAGELMTPILAEQDDATAIAANPGQIALLRGWNLTYLHSQVESGPTAGQGHGVFFAMPLPYGLGWGASLELFRPQELGADSETVELAWRSPFTVALGWQYSRRISIGLASRWFFCSSDPAINGLWAIDLGVTLRLSRHFAMAVTAHSINDPHPQSAGSDMFRFGRQWSLGLLLRPLRRDHLSLAAEVTYAEHDDRVTIRGVAAVRPLPGWTVSADVGGWFAGGETGMTLSVSTELAFSTFAVGGGARIDGLADGDAAFGGYSVMASASDDGHSVLAERPRIVHLILDDSPTTRNLAAYQRILLRAANDPSVRGILLQPRSGFSASLGETQDLRWMLDRVQRAGKQVACYLDEGSGSGYFLCSSADRVFVNEAGGIRVSGLRMTTIYLGEAMDRLGVRFEMIRVGEYKGSPEQLTQGGPSAETRAQTNSYLSSTYRRYIWELAHARNMETREMMRVIDGGPYLADGAVEAGLADSAIFADELNESLEELFGRRFRLDRDYAGSLERRRSWRGGPAVAVVHIDGNLVDGNGWDAGPEFFRSSGARRLSRAIDWARKNRRVKALVLRIDSPGGSVLASDVVWRQVRRARKSMPVIASMGGVAASGGYYVASAADEIYAAPTTLTGSIGVFYGKFELSALMNKFGVHAAHYRRGKRAGHNDWTRRWTDEERRALTAKVQRFYDRFLDRVVEGRDNFETREQVDAVARGRIWSGSQAKQRGLVDEIGGLQHAIERAAERADLGNNYEVIHLPRRKRTLLEKAVTLIGFRAEESSPAARALPPAISQALQVAAPIIYAEPHTTQALLPYAYELVP